MEKFSQRYLHDLNQFSAVVWGNPEALVGHLFPDVEFLDLGEYSSAFQDRFDWRLQSHGKILVRDEYCIALRALRTDPCYQCGAYVTGQPGIGKTYFLVYALIYLLGQRQPVALHHLGGLPFYVLFKDTATLHALEDAGPLVDCGLVWALTNSYVNIRCPPASFRAYPGRIRVIQTTSPMASRWRGWSEQWSASRYIMDIWTEQEIENLGVLLGLDVERLKALAKKWGTTPGTLLQLSIERDNQVEARYCADSEITVAESPNILRRGRQLDFRGPSSFYFIRPRKLKSGVISRMLVSMVIPTQTLSEMLAEGLREQDNVIRLLFYKALSQREETRRAAGFIFGSWFHIYVSAGERIRCHWVSQGLDDDMAELPTKLPRTTVPIRTTSQALTTQIPPYYWPTSNANFPGIDSALVLENEIFAFQVTIGVAHQSPIEGLYQLRNRLPKELKDLPWRMVFVGADKVQVKYVARHWAGELWFPKGKCVLVGWSAMDPVQECVPYKVFRDEADPVPKASDEPMEIEGEERA